MGKVHKFRVNANPLTEVKSVLGVARFFRRHCEDVKGTTETQKAFCTRRFCSANIHRHAPQYMLKMLHFCLQPMNGDLWNMDQETKYRAAKKYMARKVFIRNVFFLAALAALYLHMSLTHSPFINSERSTRQCACIWSNNLLNFLTQASWRLYEIRRLPTS